VYLNSVTSVGVLPFIPTDRYGEKCDIWSCGVLMYMMLSGVPPFYGATRKEVMQKISKGKFSFKSKVWSIISKEAKELIEKMLTLNPDKRPSAREVLNHPWFIKDQSVKINTAQYLENMSRYEVVPLLKIESVATGSGYHDLHHDQRGDS
jgi:serine/threonine protein kinase